MNKLLVEVLTDTLRLVEQGESLVYEAYVELTDIREKLVDEIQGGLVLSPDEKILLKQIIDQDEVILLRMQELKNEAESGIHRINDSKKQKDAYSGISSYNDSFMFDKKK
jgi:hypothetical protein